jgi:hypothetical protein
VNISFSRSHNYVYSWLCFGADRYLIEGATEENSKRWFMEWEQYALSEKFLYAATIHNYEDSTLFIIVVLKIGECHWTIDNIEVDDTHSDKWLGEWQARYPALVFTPELQKIVEDWKRSL